MAGTAAVRLVPLEEAHIARYMSLSDDPVLTATMGWHPFGPDEGTRFLSYVRGITVPCLPAGRTDAFSVVAIEEGTPIGYVSLKGIRDRSPGAEVGIAIMDAAYRGQGLGTEALRQAANYAFRELGLSVLTLTVFTDNTPAIRSYEKLGFTRAELLPNSWTLPDGTLTDMWLMELYDPDTHPSVRETPSTTLHRRGRGAAQG
jgi:RimJ/RimL family protein N-acetyltransferase